MSYLQYLLIINNVALLVYEIISYKKIIPFSLYFYIHVFDNNHENLANNIFRLSNYHYLYNKSCNLDILFWYPVISQSTFCICYTFCDQYVTRFHIDSLKYTKKHYVNISKLWYKSSITNLKKIFRAHFHRNFFRKMTS